MPQKISFSFYEKVNRAGGNKYLFGSISIG